ncbi:MAG: hypothetical protein H0U95_04960 [Bacteroidetes bacterium]|nr:hypothetical protein [Bacteroidota bacterium]
MINIHNYKDSVQNLDYSTLPATYWKTHQFVEKATENYTNWNIYNSSEPIKKTIDAYFIKLDEFLKKHYPQPKHELPNNIHVVKIANSHQETNHTEHKVKPTKVIASKEIATEDEEIDFSFVERIPEEIKFIKRFLSFHGKKKTKDDFLRFINALQRAMIEKKVRKASPYAKHIDYIQDKLIMVFNKMKKAIPVEINEEKLLELKGVILEEKVMPSVMLIKRYITLNGKYAVKDKAQLLLNAMDKAFKLKKITKMDKYNKLLDQMHANLSIYIKSKTQKILSIPKAELNGLNGVLGCGCNLSGIDTENEMSCLERDTVIPIAKNTQGIMNSIDFARMQFKTLGFAGKYRKLIGDPNKGFTTMVYGKPKMGKSYLCIDFAGYLARNHGKVLYVAKEEGLDFTLQEKLNSKEVAHPNLDVANDIPNDLSPYDFIFLDSVNKLGLSSNDLEALKHASPGKSFVYIFQTTKEGNFRGANEFQHDVDVVINIPEKGLAVQNGRFNQGGEMRIFDNDVMTEPRELEGIKKKKREIVEVKNVSNALPLNEKSSRFPDWTEPKDLSPSDWQKLKHIKKYYDEGNYAEAMDYAMYSSDTTIREEIPPNVWLAIGGQLTSTGREKLKQLLLDYPEK